MLTNFSVVFVPRLLSINNKDLFKVIEKMKVNIVLGVLVC